MGVLYLLGDISPDDRLTYYLYFIALHSLGILYFWKVHRLIFKSNPQGGRAVFFGLIGMGFGQVYNLQLKKGVLFFLMIIGLVIIGPLDAWGLETKTLQITLLGMVLLTLIDAGFSAENAGKRIQLLKRKQELQEKLKKLLAYRQDNFEFGLDTNILMHESDLLDRLMEQSPSSLFVSMSVYKELDGLKNNKDPLTRKKAQFAFDVIEKHQKNGLIKLIETPTYNELRRRGLNDSPDDKIIGTYLQETNKGQYKIIFLSNDKGARIIARNAGLPVAEV